MAVKSSLSVATRRLYVIFLETLCRADSFCNYLRDITSQFVSAYDI